MPRHREGGRSDSSNGGTSLFGRLIMRVLGLALVAVALGPSVLISDACAQSTRVAGWAIDRSVDPFSDAVTALAVSPEGPQGRRNSISLNLSCEGGEVAVALTHKPLGGNTDRRVLLTYRFDDETPIGPLPVQLGLDRRTTRPFLNTPDRTAPFIAAASSAQQVVLRIVDPSDERTITTALPLTGFARVVDALDCH